MAGTSNPEALVRGQRARKDRTREQVLAALRTQLKMRSADALTWRIQRESLMKENQELRDNIVSFSPEHGKVIGINGMSGKRD
jgi:hypothetical protein